MPALRALEHSAEDPDFHVNESWPYAGPTPPFPVSEDVFSRDFREMPLLKKCARLNQELFFFRLTGLDQFEFPATEIAIRRGRKR
jgi:hypothetical protein